MVERRNSEPRRIMKNGLRAIALSAAFSAMVLCAPAAAQSLFGNRGGDKIPGHSVHNQAPDAPPAALSWQDLMALEVRVETPAPLQTVFHVTYPDSVKSRDGTVVRIKGFMYPLEAGETHTYFLLSASCPFCLPASSRGLGALSGGLGLDERCDSLAALVIEARRGFVGENDGRPVDHGAGEPDSLRLTVGQGRGTGTAEFGHPEPFQHLPTPRVVLGQAGRGAGRGGRCR